MGANGSPEISEDASGTSQDGARGGRELGRKIRNAVLSVIEEEKRVCEKNSDFGKNFIQLSRNVYKNNDKRAKIKSDINKLLGSNLKEVKSY